VDRERRTNSRLEDQREREREREREGEREEHKGSARDFSQLVRVNGVEDEFNLYHNINLIQHTRLVAPADAGGCEGGTGEWEGGAAREAAANVVEMDNMSGALL
jgi:hypothetical protein